MSTKLLTLKSLTSPFFHPFFSIFYPLLSQQPKINEIPSINSKKYRHALSPFISSIFFKKYKYTWLQCWAGGQYSEVYLYHHLHTNSYEKVSYISQWILNNLQIEILGLEGTRQLYSCLVLGWYRINLNCWPVTCNQKTAEISKYSHLHLFPCFHSINIQVYYLRFTTENNFT